MIHGVTFDPHLKFHKHIESIVNRAKPRLNILKLLTGTDWGQQKETIMATFKSLVGSILTYAKPVWFLNTRKTSINRLQIIQNSALCIATGSEEKRWLGVGRRLLKQYLLCLADLLGKFEIRA